MAAEDSDQDLPEFDAEDGGSLGCDVSDDEKTPESLPDQIVETRQRRGKHAGRS